MSNFGETIRHAREAQGLTVQQISDAIHINPSYLSALEEERLDGYPAEVYARGFLKSYASYLGLDPGPLLEEFQLALHPGGMEPILGRRRSRSEGLSSAAPDRMLSRSSGGLFPYAQSPTDERGLRPATIPALLVAAACLFVVITRGGPLIQRLRDRLPGHLHPNGAAAAVKTPPAKKAPPPAPRQVPATPSAPLVVSLRSIGWVYLQVKTDLGRDRNFSGEWFPGEHQTWTGRKRISVYADRGNNVEATFNGKDIGKLTDAKRKAWRGFTLTPVPAPGSAAGKGQPSTPAKGAGRGANRSTSGSAASGGGGSAASGGGGSAGSAPGAFGG